MLSDLKQPPLRLSHWVRAMQTHFTVTLNIVFTGESKAGQVRPLLHDGPWRRRGLSHRVVNLSLLNLSGTLQLLGLTCVCLLLGNLLEEKNE